MFLQTGLGLARNQWDANFRAFDPYQRQLLREADLPWMEYREGDWTISSQEIPQELWKWWQVTDKVPPGYQAGVDCYYWGYRPPDAADAVLFGVRSKFGLGALPAPFKICSGHAPDPVCPGCPVPAPCPPPSELTPECPPCAAPLAQPVKYGVNVGLLVAGALTAGVGYYGYRKGWFRRKAA